MRLKRYAFDMFVFCAITAMTGCGAPVPFLAAPTRSPGSAPAAAKLQGEPAPPATVQAAGAPVAEAKLAEISPAIEDAVHADARERLADHIAKTYRIAAGPALQIVDEAYRQADARRIPATLLLAVIARESSFRSHAVSRVGAVGLMQIRPQFHDRRRARLGLQRALTDPSTNITVGADVLKECLERSRGDVVRALVKYSGSARNYPAKVARIESSLIEVARGRASALPVPVNLARM